MEQGDPLDIIEESSDGRFLRYREVLSRNEFKVIYLGLNHETGCQISWHEVPLNNVPPDALPKIKEELEVLSKLKHDNLISWLDHWYKADGSALVFITELLPEGSLQQFLQKIGTPRLKIVRQWTRHILNGLKYLHSQTPQIIHGCMKLENLYVIPNTGVVKIGGLGKSVFFHNESSRALFSSRLEYTAPEMLRGKKVEGVDVYSLGMCLLEMCTGSPPFEECKSPASTFHSLISGRKPLALSRIANEDVVEFISACIKQLSERPTISQLLQSEFLNASPDLNSANITLKPKGDYKCMEGGQVDIEMLVPMKGSTAAQMISFSFNLETDIPDAVAAEMVQELGLPAEQRAVLSSHISERLYLHFHQECPTPSTRRESISESLDCEDEEFIRERRYSRLKLIEDESMALPAEHWSLPALSSRSLSILESASALVMHTPQIRLGADNNEEDVRLLHVLLSEKYGLSLQANGLFGKKAESQVRRYQEEVGEEVTGIVTPELWASLLESLRTKRECHQLNEAEPSDASLI